MSRTRFLSQLCLVGSMLGVSSMAMAQGESPIPSPTAEHKIVCAEEGTWDATIKSYPNGPESEPTISKGVEVNTVLSGGLWLTSAFQADFGGMKFEGRGQFGYDPAKKKYVGTWVDSMSPSLTVLEGCYDAKTKTMTYTGDGVCPMDGSKVVQRMVTTTKADGSREFTLYLTGHPDGRQGSQGHAGQVHEAEIAGCGPSASVRPGDGRREPSTGSRPSDHPRGSSRFLAFQGSLEEGVEVNPQRAALLASGPGRIGGFVSPTQQDRFGLDLPLRERLRYQDAVGLAAVVQLIGPGSQVGVQPATSR